MYKIVIGVQTCTRQNFDVGITGQRERYGAYISGSLPYVLTRHEVVLMGDGIASI